MEKQIIKEFTTLNDKLKKFGSLEKGWDGYDSEIISKKCIFRTNELLDFLFSKKDSFPNFVAPDMCPVPTGNVQIEWEIRNVCLEIEIYPDHYDVLSGSPPDYNQGTFSTTDEVLHLVDDFFQQIGGKSERLADYIGTLIERELRIINDATKEIHTFRQWLELFDCLNKVNQGEILSEMHSKLITIPLYKHLTEEKLIRDLTK